MKINEDLIYRTITDEHILIPVGKTALDHNGVFVMTEVGGRIWDLLRQEKEKEEIIHVLLEEYDVEEQTLRADVDAFLDKLVDSGLLTL